MVRLPLDLPRLRSLSRFALYICTVFWYICTHRVALDLSLSSHCHRGRRNRFPPVHGRVHAAGSVDPRDRHLRRLTALALKQLEISLAYAVWAGVGTAAVAVIGMAALGESVNALKLASIALVIGGVVGLNLSGAN